MSLVRQPIGGPHEISPEVAKRISWLRRRLLSWFARNGRSFPWREAGRTSYEVIVAEILLQRTTAAGVARAYSGFIDRYPSWASLAQAPLEELENALMPLGLWRQKALAFQQFAQTIEAKPTRALHALALRLVRSKRFLEVNWAALDFGALVCRARNPLCPECTLRARCHYARSRQLQPTSSEGVL